MKTFRSSGSYIGWEEFTLLEKQKEAFDLIKSKVNTKRSLFNLGGVIKWR